MVTYLPQFMEESVVRGRLAARPRVLFPSYLFVQASLSLYHKLRSTVGISRLVTQGGEPSGLTDHAVQAIRAREGADGYILLDSAPAPEPVTFAAGIPLRVTEGPMVDKVGICKGMNAVQRVSVLFSIMGKDVVGQFSVGALEAA